MKTLQINIQTLLFLSENTMTVLGAYNENSKILVYNMPLVRAYGEKETFLGMLNILDDLNKPVESTFQTDSFGINFYNHNTGGSSEFHEVTGKSLGCLST